MHKQREVKSPVPVFYSYAPEDEKLRALLESHLSLLRQQGLIREWHTQTYPWKQSKRYDRQLSQYRCYHSFAH